MTWHWKELPHWENASYSVVIWPRKQRGVSPSKPRQRIPQAPKTSPFHSHHVFLDARNFKDHERRTRWRDKFHHRDSAKRVQESHQRKWSWSSNTELFWNQEGWILRVCTGPVCHMNILELTWSYHLRGQSTCAWYGLVMFFVAYTAFIPVSLT